MSDAQSWFDTRWHYVSVDYNGRELGLLVETDDEDAAKRDAEDLCVAFGVQAKVRQITKVVIQ
jgi:hypothetical protein